MPNRTSFVEIAVRRLIIRVRRISDYRLVSFFFFFFFTINTRTSEFGYSRTSFDCATSCVGGTAQWTV